MKYTDVPRPEPEATRFIDVHIYTLDEEQEARDIESTLQHISQENQPSDDVVAHTEPPKYHTSTLALLCVAIMILALSGKVYLYVLPLLTPVATITIIPTSQQVRMTQNITIVTETGHMTRNEIAGRLLSSPTISQVQTVAATGKTIQPAQSGEGTVTFYNAGLSAQTIVAGTLLTGVDGIQVATSVTVTVPGATYPTFGIAPVVAHAVQPGAAGNIKAGDIYGACCLLNISAANSAFTGGQEAQEYQSVAKVDIDTAASGLTMRLTQAATAALQIHVRSSEALVIPPACTQNTTTDHQPGDRATEVRVTVSKSCTCITYDSQAFQQRVAQAQSQAASKQYKEGYRLSGTAQIHIQTVAPGATPGTETLTVQSTGTWVYQFSREQLNALAIHIAGKTTQQATQYLLHTPGVQQVSVGNVSSPLPRDPQKIQFLLFGSS